METKDILRSLREKNKLTQDQMAERLMVTRQAVSRWENGDTQPNTDTLRILSKEFNVSINTLLGSPRQLICQCCGMPLDDAIIGRNKDGSLNEDYCQWCYADGTYTYSDMDDLIRVCVPNMVQQGFTEDQARTYMQQMLPKLDYWKRYDELSDDGQFCRLWTTGSVTTSSAMTVNSNRSKNSSSPRSTPSASKACPRLTS